MKNIKNNFSLSLLALCMVMTTLMSGCSRDTVFVETQAEAEGCVELSISIPQTRAVIGADYAAAMEQSVLKIYDASGTLVRRYEPATSAPSQIYMVSGDYSVTVLVGDSTPATFDSEECTFYGESDFEIVASSSKSVDINCQMVNHVVAVQFDESLDINLDEGYQLTVIVANEYDESVAANSATAKLIYTEDNTGYFIVDGESVTNIAWSFSGIKSFDGSAVAQTGVITSPSAHTQTTLSFDFTSSLQVSSLSIMIDDTLAESDDSFSFSPQPTVTGYDFDLTTVQVADGSSFTLNVNSLNDLSTIDIEIDDVLISPLVNGEVVDVAEYGVSYVAESSISGKLTLTTEAFYNFSTGGQNSLYVKLYDVSGSYGGGTMEVVTTGVTGVSNVDYWNNTGSLMAQILTPNPGDVTIKYRVAGDTDWISCPATAVEGSEDGIYSAPVSAVWDSALNSSGNTIYSLAQGIRHSVKYEYFLTVGDLELPVATFIPSGTTQTIPSGDMNSSSIPCFSSSSSSSTTWCSGNNSFTSSLCTQGTRDGATCAKLATSSSLGVIAAGNLIYGQFNFSSFTGYVYFGQSYSWTTRPNSLKFKYSATLGTISSGTDTSGTNLTAGGSDMGRVFVAIVEWDSRHVVTAGTSGASNTWDPVADMSVDEGRIIGYASLFIEESTEGETMYEAELPIYYYDMVTRPNSEITLVISAASSAYGDYLMGSTSSVLWLDDFEFGY